MYSKVAWVLLSSGTQVQPQVILDPAYLPNYLSVSYGYGLKSYIYRSSHWKCSIKKLFLKNSQSSQENNCVRAATLLKGDFTAGVFLWVLQKF